MQRWEISDEGPEVLAHVTVLTDGMSKTKVTGNILGLFGIPPQGGIFWTTSNGASGYVESESEAIEEIKKQSKLR